MEIGSAVKALQCQETDTQRFQTYNQRRLILKSAGAVHSHENYIGNLYFFIIHTILTLHSFYSTCLYNSQLYYLYLRVYLASSCNEWSASDCAPMKRSLVRFLALYSMSAKEKHRHRPTRETKDFV